MAETWPIWRLVTDHRASVTLEEVDRHYWIEDVLDANEALDIQLEIEAYRRGG